MAMFIATSMELGNFRKILVYLVVTLLLIAHPCSSYADVTPSPTLSVLQMGTHLISPRLAPSEAQVLYRCILDDSDSPAPSSSEAAVSSPSDNSPPAPPIPLNEDSPPPPAPVPAPTLSTDSPPPAPTPSSVSVAPPETMPPNESPPLMASPPSSISPSLALQLPPISSDPVPPLTAERLPSKTKTLTVAVSVVLGAVLCITGLFAWLHLRKKKMQKNNIEVGTPRSEEPIAMFGIAAGAANGGNGSDGSDINPVSQGFSRKLPKRYFFHTLATATSNFNDKNKLGEGGFGPVFKGILKDEKREIAVKRVSKRARGATNQYKAEVQILTTLSHRNLVELLGWCDEEGEFLLVYKFMPNGSLNSQLYDSRLLTWGERYNIVLGLASALNYLHEECEECVLHRDIKPDNVLLDSSFNAKLSDFGLARLVDHDVGAKNTILAGTMGYMAPEHLQESIASKESDIYSFGVVLLEIACGRPPVAKNADTGMVTMLIDLVWNHYGQKEILKMADKRLNGEFDTKQMECMMTVGLWCAHPFYNERPTIGDVIHVLKFNAPFPELPTKKPPLLPALPDLRLLLKDTSVNQISSVSGLSGSTGYTTQSSHASSSTSGSVAIT